MTRNRMFMLAAGLVLSFLLPACSKSLQLIPNSISAKAHGVGYGLSMPPGQMLTISQRTDLGMPKAHLYPDSVYTTMSYGDSLFTALPAGYAGKIVSFSLPQGYMAVFAQNSDGTGPSALYVAVDSSIHAELPSNLQNKISFVRYIKVNNPDKKGAAAIKDADVLALGTSWFYGWSLNRNSLPGQQFVPMTWGKWAANDANVDYLVGRSDVDHLLSFNEPDNKSQSNIPNIDTAVNRYEIMMKTGLRLGAPATTQGDAFPVWSWLYRFMSVAAQRHDRVDVLPLHWYDWGNQTHNQPTDSLTAEVVFKRFQVYVNNVHTTFPNQAIWITEFNANPIRTNPVIQEYFMKLASDWMNATPWIERYSFFFPAALPATNSDGSLTAIGQYWHDLSSTKAFSGNILAPGTVLLND